MTSVQDRCLKTGPLMRAFIPSTFFAPHPGAPVNDINHISFNRRPDSGLGNASFAARLNYETPASTPESRNNFSMPQSRQVDLISYGQELKAKELECDKLREALKHAQSEAVNLRISQAEEKAVLEWRLKVESERSRSEAERADAIQELNHELLETIRLYQEEAQMLKEELDEEALLARRVRRKTSPGDVRDHCSGPIFEVKETPIKGKRPLRAEDINQGGTTEANFNLYHHSFDQTQALMDKLAMRDQQQREMIVSFVEGSRLEAARQHEAAITTIRACAQEQVSYNLDKHINIFSAALSSEVRALLSEVEKLREERCELQRELSFLLSLRSKYAPQSHKWTCSSPSRGGSSSITE